MDKIEVFIHSDKTILLARDYGNYFNHYSTNDEENGLIRTFPITAIPLDSLTKALQYSFRDLVSQCIEMFRNTIEEKQEDISLPETYKGIWVKILTTISDKNIIDKQDVQNWGKFKAFQLKESQNWGEFDKMIEIKFEDRTHLRMIKGFPYVKIYWTNITKLTSPYLCIGDSISNGFEFSIENDIHFNRFLTDEERDSLSQYLKTGLEYMEWAFMSQEERFAKEKEEIIAQHRLQEILKEK